MTAISQLPKRPPRPPFSLGVLSECNCQMIMSIMTFIWLINGVLSNIISDLVLPVLYDRSDTGGQRGHVIISLSLPTLSLSFSVLLKAELGHSDVMPIWNPGSGAQSQNCCHDILGVKIQRLGVSLSGGVDSMVLIFILRQMILNKELKSINMHCPLYQLGRSKTCDASNMPSFAPDQCHTCSALPGLLM